MVSSDQSLEHARLLTIALVFRDERARTSGISWRETSPYNIEEGTVMMPFGGPLPSTAASLNAEITFDDTGQSWIWDYDFNLND